MTLINFPDLPPEFTCCFQSDIRTTKGKEYRIVRGIQVANSAKQKLFFLITNIIAVTIVPLGLTLGSLAIKRMIIPAIIVSMTPPNLFLIAKIFVIAVGVIFEAFLFDDVRKYGFSNYCLRFNVLSETIPNDLRNSPINNIFYKSDENSIFQWAKAHYETDPKKAVAYYEELAKKNHLPSILELVELSKDPRKKQRYLLQAANLGSTSAQFNLGLLLIQYPEKGLKGTEEAFKWFEMAANGGSADAMLMASVMADLLATQNINQLEEETRWINERKKWGLQFMLHKDQIKSPTLREKLAEFIDIRQFQACNQQLIETFREEAGILKDQQPLDPAKREERRNQIAAALARRNL